MFMKVVNSRREHQVQYYARKEYMRHSHIGENELIDRAKERNKRREREHNYDSDELEYFLRQE